MKRNKYTVVGLCLCGCDEPFVYQVEANTPAAAIKKATRDRAAQNYDSRIVAVLEGYAKSLDYEN